MKKFNVCLIVLVMPFVFSCSPKREVPQAVLTAFQNKFPTAEKVNWDKENETEWEAEFMLNNVSYSANFSTEGMWTETEYEIKAEDLPAAVTVSLDSLFMGYQLEGMEVTETRDGIFYEVELEKGESTVEVVLAADGTIVKQEEVEEDDDD